MPKRLTFWAYFVGGAIQCRILISTHVAKMFDYYVTTGDIAYIQPFLNDVNKAYDAASQLVQSTDAAAIKQMRDNTLASVKKMARDYLKNSNSLKIAYDSGYAQAAVFLLIFGPGKITKGMKAVGKAVDGVTGVAKDAKKIDNEKKDDKGSKGSDAGKAIPKKLFSKLPNYVKDAYSKYNTNGWNGNYAGQTAGTKAGGTYKNLDGPLPNVDAKGTPITYKEFDVNNKLPDASRDAERFVVGSDGSIYYTDSHYGDKASPSGLDKFIKIE